MAYHFFPPTLYSLVSSINVISLDCIVELSFWRSCFTNG